LIVARKTIAMLGVFVCPCNFQQRQSAIDRRPETDGIKRVGPEQIRRADYQQEKGSHSPTGVIAQNPRPGTFV
jgi:hypothetical protein